MPTLLALGPSLSWERERRDRSEEASLWVGAVLPLPVDPTVWGTALSRSPGLTSLQCQLSALFPDAPFLAPVCLLRDHRLRPEIKPRFFTSGWCPAPCCLCQQRRPGAGELKQPLALCSLNKWASSSVLTASILPWSASFHSSCATCLLQNKFQVKPI